MPRHLNCYVVIITLISGIFVIPPLHQAKAENEEQIRDLFKRNMTRNDFSNLLQSLIKLNEQRLGLVNKLSKLEDYGVLNEVLRSGQNKTENADLKNVYLIILNQTRSNLSRRNMGEQVMEPIPSPVTANKFQKRSIDSPLQSDSTPLDGASKLELQTALNLTENTRINPRTKNRYKIDDGSHVFSTLNPYHNLQAELIDTKQFASSEDKTEEVHQPTTPRVSIQIKLDPKRERDRFEIVTNTNTSDYEDETISDFSATDKSSESYSDSDLTSENERNSKIMKIRDVFSNDKDDKLFMPEENIESARGFNNVGQTDLFESSEVLTNTKPVSIETYREVTENTNGDYTEYNTRDKKKYKLIRNKEIAREKPHYIDQNPLITKEDTDKYSHINKQPKIVEGDSSERGHRNTNVKIDISAEVDHSYKRPKQTEEHSDEHDDRIKHHIDEVKSIEKDIPKKASKVQSDHYRDDDHRINEEKSYGKDYSKEHNSNSKYSNENEHRISLNSKKHKSSEEDEGNKYSSKYKEYFKEVAHKSETNSHKSNEQHYSNKQPKRISGQSSEDNHRMSDKSNEQNLNKKHTNNENDHRISLGDYAKNQNNNHKSSLRHSDENDHRINRDDNKSYEKESIVKHKISSKHTETSVEVDRSYERPKQIDEYSHSNRKPKIIERDSSERGHSSVNVKKEISAEVDHSYKRPKQTEEHSGEQDHHRLSKNKSYEKEQGKKHRPSSTQSSEETHKINEDKNKSYEKRVDIKKPKTTPKSSEDLTDHKWKIHIKSDKSNEDEGHKSYKNDARSEENDHRIKDSEVQEKKNENDHNYKNTKINRDDSKENEPHENAYLKPNKDAPPDSRMSQETSKFDEIRKNIPDKSEGVDKEFLEDDHGDKQMESGKDYEGEDNHNSEDYGKADSRGVLRGKSQETKHSKHSPELDERGPEPKPQALRKNFQKCIGKKATKLCAKSCITAYKNVCKKLKCSSKSKKALKQECKRTCRIEFSTRDSSKYSDESS